MENEDKDIRGFFSDFKPRPASTTRDFMARFERSMDSVEMIRARQKATARRGRLALLGATLVGFVSGFVLALLLPEITMLFGRMLGKFVSFSAPDRMILADVMSYIVIGVITVAASLTTYEIINRRHLSGLKI